MRNLYNQKIYTPKFNIKHQICRRVTKGRELYYVRLTPSPQSVSRLINLFILRLIRGGKSYVIKFSAQNRDPTTRILTRPDASTVAGGLMTHHINSFYLLSSRLRCIQNVYIHIFRKNAKSQKVPFQ